MKAQLLKPIKAPNEQIPFSDKRIRYPMFASIKYDGFRGTLINGIFRSPALKEFGNKNLEKYFASIVEHSLIGENVFDGEIWHPTISFSDLSSRLRSHDGDLTGVEYHIFDSIPNEQWNGEWDAHSRHNVFAERYVFLKRFMDAFHPLHCRLVKQTLVIGKNAAADLYAEHLAAGHEGMMLRDPQGLYKHNRCTHNESNLYKFKNFITHDARIIEVVQRRKMRDDVERTYDPVGQLEKVHSNEAYELDEAVGAFKVVLEDGRETSINLGRGYTYNDRVGMWRDRHNLVGKHVEFKYMPHGSKNLPRIGSILRFRPDKD